MVESAGFGGDGAIRQRALAPSRLEGFLFWSLIVLLAAMPLPFGSARPWAWSLAAVIVALLLLLHALWTAGSAGTRLRVPAHKAWVPVLIASPAIVWAVVQTLPLGGPWANPLWEAAGKVLGTNLPGRISTYPFAGITALMRLTTEVGIFALALVLCRSRRRARAALAALAAIAALYALYGLIAFVATPTKLLWFDRWAYLGDLTSSFVNRNSFATFAGLGLLASVAVLAQRLDDTVRESPGGRALIADLLSGGLIAASWPILGIVVLVGAILLSHSRGGFLSVGVGLLVLLGLLVTAGRMAKAAKLLVAGLAIAVAVLIVTVSGTATLERLGQTVLEQEERGQVYRIVRTGIADRPWVGHGYGNFDFASRAYHDGSVIPNYDKAHDDYLEAAFELGIPAAASLVAAVGYVGLCCLVGARRRRRDAVYPALGAAATALVACHALVDFSLQIPAVAAWFAALLGLGYAQSWSSTRGGTG
jgi:O-antigen ligase